MSDDPIEQAEPETEKQGNVLRETIEGIDNYWFGFGSPTTLGVFRIIVCSLTVVALLMLTSDWEAWFTERGFVPSWLGARFLSTRVELGFGTNWSIPRISLLAGVTDPRVTLAFFIATIVAGILTAFGLWTRASSVALALGVISLHHRNAAILHGGDTVMRLGCMYLAIAPSGKACSVDRLIGLWKGRISVSPVQVSMWPQRIMAFNVALLYLTTLLLKWGGGMWQDGTATYYTARLNEFRRFPVPSFINDLPFVKFTTYGTLFTEFALGTLVFFRPLRKYVLLCGILLHIHIEYSMNIPLFSYFMVSSYLVFYDGDEVAAWAGRIGERHRRWHVVVRFPPGTRLRPPAIGFLDAIDPFKLIHYVPGTEDGWTATRHDGTALPVAKAIWTRSMGSWFFGWVPHVWDKLLPNAVEPCPADPVPALEAEL